MSKDTSGPAFPVKVAFGSDGIGFAGEEVKELQTVTYAGATLREYAAIKAMQGLLADGMGCPEYVAMRAVKAADALLAELEK